MAGPGGNGSNHRAFYSGRKRFHCLVHQTITTPYGLIFSLYGPEEGRRHDLTLILNSDISERLWNSLTMGDRQYYIYGDAAYVLSPWLQTAYERIGASDEQEWYSKRMSAARVIVERSYKDLKQVWTRNDYSRLLQGRSPFSFLYVGSAFFLNFNTSLENWGQVGHNFSCRAPSLEEYLTL